MNPTQTYEQMQFRKTINTIDTDYFPPCFPLHWHKYAEVIHLPQDANTNQLPVLDIQKNTYRLEPGDLLFIWPGELHEILENPSRQLIGLQFAPTLLLEFPDFAPYFNLFRTFHHLPMQNYPELVSGLNAQLFHMLHLQQSADYPFARVESRITLYEMFIQLGTYLNENNESSTCFPQATANYEKINEACQFIIENCNHDITLNSVAHHIGFSPCYFSRTFKTVTGTGFVEYLTQQRVKQAESLLADANLSMTEVSYRSGFHSISTFNRVFHAKKGCSPREYRKYYLEEHTLSDL